eukprot:6908554-Lingulodinium_polyedra.AAC.1
MSPRAVAPVVAASAPPGAIALSLLGPPPFARPIPCHLPGPGPATPGVSCALLHCRGRPAPLWAPVLVIKNWGN